MAPLKSFKTASLSIDKRLENVYYDKDLRAAEAIVDLFQQEVEVSRIHRVLSVGMLGLQKNRRLVPTRWSISATDNIISVSLIKSIVSYAQIDLFEVYKHSHLGNYYSVILIPDDVWSFEMKEVWFDKNGNLGMGVDFEDAMRVRSLSFHSGCILCSQIRCCRTSRTKEKKSSGLSFERDSFRLCHAGRRMAN